LWTRNIVGVRATKKIKVVCQECDGRKYVEEKSWDTGTTVKIQCHSCKGRGYVEEVIYGEETGLEA